MSTDLIGGAQISASRILEKVKGRKKNKEMFFGGDSITTRRGKE